MFTYLLHGAFRCQRVVRVTMLNVDVMLLVRFLLIGLRWHVLTVQSVLSVKGCKPFNESVIASFSLIKNNA